MRLCLTAPAALLFAAITLISDLPLGASNCTNTVEATSTSAWRTITPPKEDVEVVYSAPNGWVGLKYIRHSASIETQEAGFDSMDDATDRYGFSVCTCAAGAGQ